MLQILKSRATNQTSESLLLTALAELGYSKSEDDCLLQCFELSTMEQLKEKTDMKRVFLLKRRAKINESLERATNAAVHSICLDKDLIISTDENTGNIHEINKDLVDKVRLFKCELHMERIKASF